MSTIRNAAAAAGALALTLGLAACGNSAGASSDGTTPATTSPATSGSPASGGPVTAAQICPSGSLNFGIEPYDDAAKLTAAYQKVADALGQKLGCTVNLDITSSYVAEIVAMENGKLDIGEFGPLGFVFANRQAGANALVSFADKDGKVSSYTAGIWVAKGSPIKTVKDLAGHTLALSESGSTSGDAVPRKELIDAGVDKQVNTQYAGGHPEAMEALINGKVDAAEINSQTEASAEAAGQFDPSGYTEIWKSTPILNDPIAVSPNMSPQVADAIKNALINLPSADLKQIGSLLDFTAPASKPLVPVTNEDYKPLFDLADTLKLTDKDL